MKKEKEDKREKLKKIFSIIFLIIWCLVIFFFSNQDGISSTKSSSFVVGIVNAILNLFINIDLTKYELATFIIRKLAHMFVYFVLFFFIYNVFKQYKVKRIISFSYIFCLLYAISDEIHQLFINERSGQVTDVLIDMSGVVIASILLFLIIRFKRKRENRVN